MQVLALPPASKEPKVRAQLRQLARRVHPDKCSLPGAEAAFKALCLAATRAAGQTEGAQHTFVALGRRRKRNTT